MVEVYKMSADSDQVGGDRQVDPSAHRAYASVTLQQPVEATPSQVCAAHVNS